MFYIELRNVVDIICCSTCCPGCEDFIKQIFRGLIFNYCKEIAMFFKLKVLKILILIFDKFFCRGSSYYLEDALIEPLARTVFIGLNLNAVPAEILVSNQYKINN